MNKRKKLSATIYRGTFLITVVVLLLATVLSVVVQYVNYDREVEDSLVHGVKTLAIAVESDGISVLKEYNEDDRRVTLVDPDGTVVYDNEVDASTLENHSDREEIQEALATGEGTSVRRSNTLGRTTVNAAVLLNNGQVLRVSRTRYNVWSLLGQIAAPMAGVFLVAALLALILARRVSKSAVEPINDIDLSHPVESDVYEEMQPLVDHIKEQNLQITDQFRAMQEKHDEEDQMRTEFTANVSHELKTPLTSISGYAELIEAGIAQPKDVQRFAGKIHEESQRLIVLVGDIIKLSQMDDRDVPVKKEPVDLYETCQAVLSHLEHAAEKNSVTLNLQGDHVVFETAEQVVEELVFNLCDNAVKYNRPGGRVDVYVRQCVDGVELTVADTGIGIPEEDLDRIFERFYRVDKSHSKEIGGTGLGLSIVKHAASFLKARLSVESVIDKGTTIRVLF